MDKVYKYAIPKLEAFTLELPRGARFLSVQVQRRNPQAWFLVDPSTVKEERKFVLVGTGHAVPEADRLKHLGTFQLFDGEIVLHLFEYS